MTIFETPRLRVRVHTLDDAPFIHELLNEPAWLRYIGDRGIRTLDDARNYLATRPLAMQARHGFSIWALERKADGVLLGNCGLLKRDTLDDVDLGYALLTRHEGQGYAREAAAATLAYGEKTLGLKRIVAITSLENPRSQALLAKLGFQFEKTFPFGDPPHEVKLFAWHAAPATH